jgi:2-hydroxychromene-2-carboxylate isomerase
MAVIEYFYSAHSAYAYLGSARFMAIASATGRSVVHKPIDLDEVVPASGSASFKQKSDAYRAYYFDREIKRWSEHRNAPVQGRPSYHHHDTTTVNCMLVAGVEQSLNMDQLAHALLEAHWRYDADLDDDATLERVASAAGYDARALLEAAVTAPVRAAYAANTREAIERNVLGSPTYVVDGDVFYGQDRLEMVERAIDHPYAMDWSGPQTD